jgi:hypothetical protein
MEGIVSKIKKLIDKASSTDSQAEKDALMLKAQELLQNYNLEIETVISHTDDKGNVIVENDLKYEYDWELLLLDYISKNNFSKMLFWTKLKEAGVIGKAHNVSAVIYLFQFYKRALLELSIKSYESYIKERRILLRSLGLNFDTLAKKSFKNDYLKSYLERGVEGINAKMIEQKRAAQKENSKLTDIIIYNDKAVEKFVAEKYKKIKSTDLSGDESGIGYEKGFEDGKSIEVFSAIDKKGNVNIIKLIE